MSAKLYVRRLELGPMKNFVYLIGGADSREVAVIDPAWDAAEIERAAASDGKSLTAAVVSHCHQDHTNALPELLERFDLPVYAQAEEAQFSEDLRKLAGDALVASKPGDDVTVGTVSLKLLHTPGHTPGSQSVLCEGALLSGDTVFVNACGRCDMRGGDAAAMHRTISQVLLALPPETRLLPGHDYGDVKESSLSRERANNPYFQFPDVASFVDFRLRPRR